MSDQAVEMSIGDTSKLTQETPVVVEPVKEEKAPEPNIDWFSVAAHEKRVINFEKAFAVVLDKPFDVRYKMYAFGASCIFKNEDGTISEEFDVRSPNLSINNISILIDVLTTGHSNYKSKIQYIKDLSEVSFDVSLFYDSKKTFEDTQKCPKVIVEFENQEIKKIYVFKLATELSYLGSLISFKDMLQQKKNEMDRNLLIQNLFMALTQRTGPQKTNGGIVVP